MKWLASVQWIIWLLLVGLVRFFQFFLSRSLNYFSLFLAHVKIVAYIYPYNQLTLITMALHVSGTVSERHHEARFCSTKVTAGEMAAMLRKLKIKTTAKELVDLYYRLTGIRAEWHHSGWFGSGRNRRMGRTYFFHESDVAIFESHFSNS